MILKVNKENLEDILEDYQCRFLVIEMNQTKVRYQIYYKTTIYLSK
jgi:hypothetical protein